MAVIDTATRTVTTVVPTGSQAAQIAVSPDGRRVYVPSPLNSSVTVIDTATDTVAATVHFRGAFGAAFSPDGTRAYVSNSQDRTLAVIDTATATITSTITVDWLPQGVAVSPDGSRIYVGSALGTTSVVDATTNTMVGSIPTGGWSTAVLADPDGSRLYVSSLTNGTVSIVDTATLTITASIPIDQNVYQLAMAPLPPVATGLAPDHGLTTGGTTVTLTGSHLYGTTAVTFGTTPAASFTVVNDTTVTAVAPPHAAGTVDVKLTAKGRTVTAGTYTYQVPAPTITGIAPAQGPAGGGTTVTLTGSHLTGATAVAFGTTPAASFTVVNDTTVTATAPAASAAGPVDVTVTTPGGTSTITAGDRYTYTKDTTKLTANPLLLSIAPGQLSINLNLSATLTDTITGKPVPGAAITFKVGSTTVCTATTNAAGTATCTGPCPVVTVLLNLGYTATYSGSPALEAASATAGLIRIS
nr:YncE family protein [Streptomyces sp. CBMA123]